MPNFLKNFLKPANRYDHLSDNDLDRLARNNGIVSGFSYADPVNVNGFDRQYVIRQLLKREELNNSKTAILVSVFSLIISIIILPLSFYINLLQIDDLTQNGDARYIDYTLSFDEKLNQKPSLGIMNAIEDGEPILRENGGEFSTHDLDAFLGIYNQLSDVRSHSLVTDELIENNFSDGLLKAYDNKEIKSYLQKIRLEDDAYFTGFDELADLFKK